MRKPMQGNLGVSVETSRSEGVGPAVHNYVNQVHLWSYGDMCMYLESRLFKMFWKPRDIWNTCYKGIINEYEGKNFPCLSQRLCCLGRYYSTCITIYIKQSRWFFSAEIPIHLYLCLVHVLCPRPLCVCKIHEWKKTSVVFFSSVNFTFNFILGRAPQFINENRCAGCTKFMVSGKFYEDGDTKAYLFEYRHPVPKQMFTEYLFSKESKDQYIISVVICQWLQDIVHWAHFCNPRVFTQDVDSMSQNVTVYKYQVWRKQIYLVLLRGRYFNSNKCGSNNSL